MELKEEILPLEEKVVNEKSPIFFGYVLFCIDF